MSELSSPPITLAVLDLAHAAQGIIPLALYLLPSFPYQLEEAGAN
jgi:hypothetical protein